MISKESAKFIAEAFLAKISLSPVAKDADAIWAAVVRLREEIKAILEQEEPILEEKALP